MIIGLMMDVRLWVINTNQTSYHISDNQKFLNAISADQGQIISLYFPRLGGNGQKMQNHQHMLGI